MNTKFETPISFLKPEYLLEAEEKYASQQIDKCQLADKQDLAISDLVAKQLELDINVITDGAFRNLHGLRDLWMDLDGVTPTLVTSGHVYQNQNAGEVVPIVTAKVAHNPEHYINNSFSFLQGKVGDDRLVRVDIPAPSHFLVELLRNGWYDKGVYPTLDELVIDIYTAYSATLMDLYALGCRRVLLVDPSWGRLCDQWESKRLLQGGIDLTKLPLYMLWANQDAIVGVPPDMHIILYTPFGGEVSGDCADIINVLVSHNRIDSFMFDWPDRYNDILDFISLVPKGKGLIVGISDPQQPHLDVLDGIKMVIDKVTNANPGVSISMSTKGGFVNNTDLIDFSSVTETQQWSKIANLQKL